MNKFAPLHPKVSTLLHGADYNPEQWENDPDIIDKDICHDAAGKMQCDVGGNI